MLIKQFEDKNLSHLSYAILSEREKKIVLVDPARDTEPYLDFAKEKGGEIVAVIETHPHADFASSHLELLQTTGARIYISKDVKAFYPHEPFDEGQAIEIGELKLSAINTPGHSPDSISILAEEDGKQVAVFTGDTLFIGDCGRPDLREKAGNIQSTREDLARKMYHSLRKKLMKLNDDVVVYPAHGAGSLCGKNLSKETTSTIGEQKQTNWCLQEATEEEFVNNLLTDQPFIPQYFPYDVELNRKGAPSFEKSIANIPIVEQKEAEDRDPALWVVDARDDKAYKKGHLSHSMNLMENGKFETWLGTIIRPGENFYLVGDSRKQLEKLIARTAAIGYESQIRQAILIEKGEIKQEKLDLDAFSESPENYTIVDVRNKSEVKQGKIFPHAITIPLAEIRERVNEIPTGKPIVVHCAAGYRSAAASSIIQSTLDGKATVYDLGESVKQFQELTH